jgi:hypothetical protein
MHQPLADTPDYLSGRCFRKTNPRRVDALLTEIVDR